MNLDPKPWVYHNSLERAAQQSGYMATGWIYAPRPEFEVGDNPILQAVALDPDEDWLKWLDEPETDDGSYVLNGRYESFTHKRIDHARAVLTRIMEETA